MATKTTNLELNKPAYTDTADIAVVNDNFDILDTILGSMMTPVTKTISIAGWSSAVTSINSVDYYTYTVNLSKVYGGFEIGLNSSSTLPTEDEQAAFDLIKYCTSSTNQKSIILYVEEKPTVPFSIDIFGVVA